jgi:Ca2+-transporting ATPase
LASPNELRERPPTPFWSWSWRSFNNFIVSLIVASVSQPCWAMIEAVVIMAIVVLNAVLGVVQENRAEKAPAALKEDGRPKPRRSATGIACACSSRELVPGDVVLIEAATTFPPICA